MSAPRDEQGKPVDEIEAAQTERKDVEEIDDDALMGRITALNTSNSDGGSAGDSGSLFVTVLASLGMCAFLWLASLAVGIGWVPGIASDAPAPVVVLDTARFFLDSPNMSDADRQLALRAFRTVADNLAADGYVVIRNDTVIAAPESRYIPNDMIFDTMDELRAGQGGRS